ncbi:cystatin-like [Hoplias malabaricus]|uniref:cystatin-like n=1 Tax=Hoplias malabaricus TaxID=27720 RepID=UPI0034636BDE
MFVKMVVMILALSLATVNSYIAGGVIDADINAPEVQEALQFAIAEYNRVTNSMWVSQVSKVIQVQQQVVSGIKYIFNVEMARTSCKKGEEPMEACEVHSDPNIAQVDVCRLVVWSQPWLNSNKLVENTCGL